MIYRFKIATLTSTRTRYGFGLGRMYEAMLDVSSTTITATRIFRPKLCYGATRSWINTLSWSVWAQKI